MKRVVFVASLAAVFVGVAASYAGAVPKGPIDTSGGAMLPHRLYAESLAEAGHPNLDPSKYRAFKYLNREMVMSGYVKGFKLEQGRLVPIAGKYLYGRINRGGNELSHVIVPRDVTIDSRFMATSPH